MAKQRTYKVQTGDSYAKIAGELFGDQRFMSALAGANADRSLHAGMEIVIPEFDTDISPRITQERAETLASSRRFYQDPETQRDALTRVMERGREMGWDLGRGVVGGMPPVGVTAGGAPADVLDPARPETYEDIQAQYTMDRIGDIEAGINPLLTVNMNIEQMTDIMSGDFGAAFNAMYENASALGIAALRNRHRADAAREQQQRTFAAFEESFTSTFEELPDLSNFVSEAELFAQMGIDEIDADKTLGDRFGDFLSRTFGADSDQPLRQPSYLGHERATEEIRAERARILGDIQQDAVEGMYGDIRFESDEPAEAMDVERVDLVAQTEAQLFMGSLDLYRQSGDIAYLPKNISDTGALLITPEVLEEAGFDYSMGETDEYMLKMGYSWMGGFWTRDPFGTYDYTTPLSGGGYAGDGQYTPDEYWRSYITGRGMPSGRGAGGGFGSGYGNRIAGFGLVMWNV